MWRKYLAGIFVLIFLLSSVCLGFLLVDESQDLSSRASFGLGQGQTEILDRLVEKQGWEVVRFEKLLSDGSGVVVGFPSGSWTKVGGVLVNEKEGVSVRLFNGSTGDSEALARSVTTDYQLKKSGERVVTDLAQAEVERFEYEFFGKKALAYVWNIELDNKLKVKAVVVMSDAGKQAIVEELLANMASVELTTKVKGEEDGVSDSAKAVALARPSVVMVVSNVCSNAVIANLTGAEHMVGRQYGFCIGGSGSGFFVSPEGHVATNGHVVKFLPETILLAGVKTGALKELLVDLLVEATRQLGSPLPKDVVADKVNELYLSSPDAVLRFMVMVDELRRSGMLKLDGEQYKFYVQLGKTPIKIDKSWQVNTGEDIVEASLVGVDYEGLTKDGFTSSDVAVLKVSKEGEYPSLPLASSDDLEVGTPIQVIGFPGIVSGTGDSSLLLDTSASAEPTVTRGVVSAVKEAKGDKKKLIQTDASITHGNSGGPAVNESGEVVGIATYGLLDEEVGGNYNFLRDVADLKVLMEANNVVAQESKVFNDWKNGLENFWISYYRFAASSFSKVKKAYSVHPTAELYLKKAEAKVGSAEDKTPRFTRTQRKLLMTISGSMMAVSVVGLSVMGIMELANRKKVGVVVSVKSKTKGNLA